MSVILSVILSVRLLCTTSTANIDAYYAKTLTTCTAAFKEVQKKGGLRRGSGSSLHEGLGLGHGSSLEVGASDIVVEMQNV